MLQRLKGHLLLSVNYQAQHNSFASEQQMRIERVAANAQKLKKLQQPPVLTGE